MTVLLPDLVGVASTGDLVILRLGKAAAPTLVESLRSHLADLHADTGVRFIVFDGGADHGASAIPTRALQLLERVADVNRINEHGARAGLQSEARAILDDIERLADHALIVEPPA